MIRHTHNGADRFASMSAKRMAEHNVKAKFLDGLAILLGCKENLAVGFPDGGKPDVLRADIERSVLFVGDAKHTETPGCTATKVRLLHYFRWLAAHVGGGNRLGIFALCFGAGSDRDHWRHAIREIASLVGLRISDSGYCQFASDLNIVWLVFDGHEETVRLQPVPLQLRRHS